METGEHKPTCWEEREADVCSLSSQIWDPAKKWPWATVLAALVPTTPVTWGDTVLLVGIAVTLT
jgi:hypothetical protein